MSLISSSFGIMDYLRGHIPPFLSINMSTETASINFPANKDINRLKDVVVNLKMPTVDSLLVNNEFNNALFIDSFNNQINQVSAKFHPDELCTLMIVYRTTLGFQSDMSYRLRITRLRLQCFFILVHSRIPPATIQDYLKNGSIFMKELIDISDLSSESISELNLDFPISLSYVSLECVLGLLENRLRRRNSFILQSNILVLLGLSKQSDLLENASSLANVFSTGQQDELWYSIVMSSCSVLTQLTNPDASSEVFFISNPNTQSVHLISRFIRMGLELYALCLTTRESNNVVTDMPLIFTIIGTIHTCQSSFKGQLMDAKHCASDIQLMLLITKCMYCLDCTIERNGYFAAFRESDGLAPVGSIINMFSTMDFGELSDTIIPWKYYLKWALDSTLSLLKNSIAKSRQVVMMQGTNAESGTNKLFIDKKSLNYI